MSTVSFAGFSRLNGSLKFRTANDAKRIDQLKKLGDTDVVILQLPSDMSKSEAAKYVLSNLAISYPDFATAEAETLLKSLAKDKDTVTVSAVAKPKKAKAPAKAKAPTVADDGKYRSVKIPGTNRVVKYDLKEMSEKEKAKVREEHNRAHAHLSYDGE